jgi:hypothetical protein
VANAGRCGRLLPDTEERHSGDTEQDNRHGTNQPEENKMEEHVHSDCQVLSSIGHRRICIAIGQAALGYPNRCRDASSTAASEGTPAISGA